MKKSFLTVSCIMLSTLLLFSSTAYSAIFTFETQFPHDSADIAWLTDFVIKENMQSVDGIAGHTEITALPDIPYTETPESFKKEVEEYCSLYSLKENSERAGFIYLFDLLSSNNSIYSVGATDNDIRDYLIGNGITYPSSVNSDVLIMARALYLAMMTGTFNASSFGGGSDIALEQALISYVSQISGINKESLLEWMPDGSVLSLDDYILAASRLSLWTSGYDVTVNTPEDEVYRLVAVMTIEKLGISVNKELSFDELKVIYTAALLGKKYGVHMNEEKLSSALNNGSTAFYILQLLGQQNAGLSIRSENSTFEEAFYAVAENTHAFDIESDEFYADIYKYDVYLSEKRSSVWVYPTAYATGSSGADIEVSANGIEIKNNFFSEVALNPALSEENIDVTVKCSMDGKSSSRTYTFIVHQGQNIDSDPEGNETATGESTSFATSDTIVSGIFSTLGINPSISSLVDNFYTTLPTSMKNVISFIAPTFDANNTISGSLTEENDTQNAASDEYFFDLLDKIGRVTDFDIQGIGGAALGEKYTPEKLSFNYVTFE